VADFLGYLVYCVRWGVKMFTHSLETQSLFRYADLCNALNFYKHNLVFTAWGCRHSRIRPSDFIFAEITQTTACGRLMWRTLTLQPGQSITSGHGSPCTACEAVMRCGIVRLAARNAVGRPADFARRGQVEWPSSSTLATRNMGGQKMRTASVGDWKCGKQ